MNLFLKRRYAHPLEREYESWIVHGIENYFSRLGLRYAIWAVSPKEEIVWPADERLLTGGKIIGLQFKQAKVAPPGQHFDRLKWQLHQPPGQFNLVQSTPEIYYCLPTFGNRDFRSEALHHCLFWRPGATTNHNVWYNNPAAITPYNHVSDSMRWGRFIEAVLSCEIGFRASQETTGYQFVERINSRVSELLRVPETGDLAESQEPLYLLAIEFTG